MWKLKSSLVDTAGGKGADTCPKRLSQNQRGGGAQAAAEAAAARRREEEAANRLLEEEAERRRAEDLAATIGSPRPGLSMVVEEEEHDEGEEEEDAINVLGGSLKGAHEMHLLRQRDEEARWQRELQAEQERARPAHNPRPGLCSAHS